MNKEIEDALHTLLHCSLKDTEYETQFEQYKIVRDCIINLQQENKQLKEELKEHKKCIDEQNEELYRRFNSLDKATTLNSVFENILTELEKWINEKINYYKEHFDLNANEFISVKHTIQALKEEYKIQELKEKYKC